MWPIPQVNDENREFWTGGRDGELRIIRCGDCGYYIHPPAPRCPRCLSANVAPEPVSGRGRVYSYTINHRVWAPGSEVPYVIVIVQLDEQDDLRVLSNLIDVPLDDVAIDLPVQVEFRERGDVHVPVFRAA